MSPVVLDLTGQRFGKLTALFRLPEKENRYYLWECVCDCGTRLQVSTKKLKRGTTTDCGCISPPTACRGTIAEDITGQRFGRLTAISRLESRNGRTRWLCECDCGEQKIASTSMLKQGKTLHCGCESQYRRYNAKLDLRGERFGRLIAVKQTKKRNYKGSVIWESLCDCGNTIEVSADSLVHGNVTSCGCRKQEIQDSIREHLTFVDGTCVEWLRSRKHRSDNTSGYRGVQQAKNGKWRVTIGFKGKRFHCGTYNTFSEAKTARQLAEKSLHEGFVLAWEKWTAMAESIPDWAQINPFIFEVTKVNGELVVYAPILDEELENPESMSMNVSTASV